MNTSLVRCTQVSLTRVKSSNTYCRAQIHSLRINYATRPHYRGRPAVDDTRVLPTDFPVSIECSIPERNRSPFTCNRPIIIGRLSMLHWVYCGQYQCSIITVSDSFTILHRRNVYLMKLCIVNGFLVRIFHFHYCRFIIVCGILKLLFIGHRIFIDEYFQIDLNYQFRLP